MHEFPSAQLIETYYRKMQMFDLVIVYAFSIVFADYPRRKITTSWPMN